MARYQGLHEAGRDRGRKPGCLGSAEATHRITRLPGDAVELDISVYPFDKAGNFPYPRRQASQFSAAEIAYIRDLIVDYLGTDREALHPIYAPKERVRDVRVRLP